MRTASVRTIGNSMQGRENNFDVIRFFAALFVIYAHAFPLSGGDEQTGFLWKIFDYHESMGSYGVYIFFTLSGFLITMSFLSKPKPRTYLKARALRILPAFELAILLSVFLLGPLVTTLSTGDYFLHPDTYKYLSNLFVFPVNFIQTLPGVFATNPFPGAVNGSLWTIPMEVVFYFFILFLGMLGWLRRKRVVLGLCILGVVAFLVSQQLLGYEGLGRYVTLALTLFIPFSFGMVLYLFKDHIPLRGVYALIALAGLILCLRFFENQVLVNLFAAYLILYIGLSRRARLYRFARFGDLSYGLYVFAFPVQQAVSYFMGRGVTPLSNFIISAIIVAVLAFLSWHLVEKRFLRLK